MCRCTLEISQDLFYSNPMIRCRCMHVLAHAIDSEGNMWAGDGEILEGTH